jgi:hypothetical protein
VLEPYRSLRKEGFVERKRGKPCKNKSPTQASGEKERNERQNPRQKNRFSNGAILIFIIRMKLCKASWAAAWPS